MQWNIWWDWIEPLTKRNWNRNKKGSFPLYIKISLYKLQVSGYFGRSVIIICNGTSIYNYNYNIQFTSVSRVLYKTLWNFIKTAIRYWDTTRRKQSENAYKQATRYLRILKHIFSITISHLKRTKVIKHYNRINSFVLSARYNIVIVLNILSFLCTRIRIFPELFQTLPIWSW